MDSHPGPSTNSSAASLIWANSLEKSLEMLHLESADSNQKTANINDIPNELLTLILKRIKQIKLIRLRLVCPRWQVVIDHIYHKTRSLHLFDRPLIFNWPQDKANLKKRFFGQFQEQEFFKICRRRTHYSGLESGIDFGNFLVKLFPNVSQFAFTCEVESDINVTVYESILLLLGKWHNTLVTLSLNVHYFRQIYKSSYYEKLFDCINSMTALRHLDLFGYGQGSFMTIGRLVPTFNRLEHFSIDWSIDLLRLMGHFEPNCTRISLCVGRSFYMNEFDRCLRSNPRLVAQVTHLDLTFEKLLNVFPMICEHCVSVQVLRLSFLNKKKFRLLANDFSQLARLTQLVSLQISNVNYCALRGVANLKPILNIRAFELNNFSVFGYREEEEQFCRDLSVLFPNMTDLTVEALNRDVCTRIQQHLSLFANLRNHRIVFLDL